MMQERKHQQHEENNDSQLDIPANANTGKHINFLDTEDQSSVDRESGQTDKETTERQKQWKEGLEEGKKAREQNS
jgi:hypothetical protein